MLSAYHDCEALRQYAQNLAEKRTICGLNSVVRNSKGRFMAETRVKLTKRLLEAQGTAPFTLNDSEVRGFRARRQKEGGAVTFEFRYRVFNRERLFKLDTWSEKTVEEARKQAVQERGKVAFGRDPQAEKDDKYFAKKDTFTVADAVAEYLEHGRTDKPDKRASSWQADTTAFNRHLIPLLGKKRLADLTTIDLAKWQAAVASGKTAKKEKMGVRALARVTGGRGAAQRGMLAVSAMLSWCVKRKLLSDNPARDVSRYQSGGHERYLSEEEGARLWDTIEALEAEKGITQAQAAIFRLLALTGARRGEIVGLRWGEVDLRRGLLLLPPARHKTGQASRPKAIPLPGAARDILAGLPRSGDWVFPKADGSGAIEPPKRAWAKVTQAAGLDGVRMHDLRHTVASWAVGAGVALPIVGKLLGHANASTTQRYAHLRQDAGASVLEAISTIYRAPTAIPDTANDAALPSLELGNGHEK
jgi:integrase